MPSSEKGQCAFGIILFQFIMNHETVDVWASFNVKFVCVYICIGSVRLNNSLIIKIPRVFIFWTALFVRVGVIYAQIVPALFVRKIVFSKNKT